MLRFLRYLLLNVLVVAGFTGLQASGFDWGALRSGSGSSWRASGPSHK